ncbi:MAG: DoxX family protein [Myxococcota bacterium]
MTTLLRHVFASIDELAPRIAFLPLLLFRVTVGWVFLQSGWGKLHNLEGVTGFFVSLGIPAAHLQAPIVSGIEFGGGLLLLLGLATRVAAAPLVGVMAVAIGTALWADIEDLSDLLALAEFGYIVILIALVVFGGGVLSLDAVVRRRLASRS